MIASIVLGLGMVVSTSLPASGHAILLGTDPGPQTTVKKTPSVVRLSFSEAVEATFGSIRVYDVNGRRKDNGDLRRADKDREVDVPVGRLGTGTFTVTWRVTSSDGHAVHGGFAFYVGAPSTISAAVPTQTSGPSELFSWGFGLVRFGWFMSFLGLVGLVVSRRWVWTPAIRAAGLTNSPAAQRFRTIFRSMLVVSWAVLTICGGLGLIFQTATLSGLSLPSVLHVSLIREAVHTASGRLWLWQFLISVVMVLPVWALARRRPVPGGPAPWILGLMALLVASSVVAALNGHARTFPAPGLLSSTVSLHLLAVGVWVGGLGSLVIAGGLSWSRLPADRRPSLVRELVPRFSTVAILAVIALVYTGSIATLSEIGSLSDLWRLRWGQVLVAKVALLGVALGLAARHLWITPRRLAGTETAQREVSRFRRSGTVETVVLFGAVALAAALIALVPGRSLLHANSGPLNVEQRAGRYTVQLSIDPTKVGQNEIHVSFVTAQGLGAGEIANATASMSGPGGTTNPVSLSLISPGHYVGEATLPSPGLYRLRVGSPRPTASTAFAFRVAGSQQASTATAGSP